jgi:hypothetical protein
MWINNEFWEKKRAKGIWHFILLDGVVWLGGSSAVFFSFIFPLAIDGKLSFLPVFANAIIIFPLAGFVWGYFMWTCNEWLYKKAKRAEQQLAAGTDKPRR